MNRHTRVMALPETPPALRIIMCAGGIGVLLFFWAVSARAADQAIPWECSSYTGEAQTRCLNTFVELQREEIAKLKEKVQVQESAVEQLKQQADRQATAAADTQRHLSAAPAVVPATPYIYSYIYPPSVGLGLYLGQPWIYGSPYYYRPYRSPRFHGYWRHHR